METDDLLVRRTLAGDKSAFGVLIDRHRPEVLRLARHVLRGAVDAEDCVQEAFLHALLGLRELRAPDRFLACCPRALALSLEGIEASDYPGQFLDALGPGDDDRSAAGYSAGMKQKARIAYATLHTPRLLVLDEPMTGLDVRERFRVLRLLDRSYSSIVMTIGR